VAGGGGRCSLAHGAKTQAHLDLKTNEGAAARGGPGCSKQGGTPAGRRRCRGCPGCLGGHVCGGRMPRARPCGLDMGLDSPIWA
jgi:hypothetical protein